MKQMRISLYKTEKDAVDTPWFVQEQFYCNGKGCLNCDDCRLRFKCLTSIRDVIIVNSRLCTKLRKITWQKRRSGFNNWATEA